MVSPHENEPDPLSPIGGVALGEYVAICRALIRTAAGSPRRIEEVLAAHGLTPQGWDRIQAEWSDRIRRDAVAYATFGQLYAGQNEAPDTRDLDAGGAQTRIE